jgi:hypothetical protein
MHLCKGYAALISIPRVLPCRRDLAADCPSLDYVPTPQCLRLLPAEANSFTNKDVSAKRSHSSRALPKSQPYLSQASSLYGLASSLSHFD